jgi:hypothetical protein
LIAFTPGSLSLGGIGFQVLTGRKGRCGGKKEEGKRENPARYNF